MRKAVRQHNQETLLTNKYCDGSSDNHSIFRYVCMPYSKMNIYIGVAFLSLMHPAIRVTQGEFGHVKRDRPE